MAKEKLTHEQIKKDLKTRLLYEEIISSVFTAAFFSFVAIICEWVIRLLLTIQKTNSISFRVSIPTILIIIFINIAIIISSAKSVFQIVNGIRKNKIKISVSKLTDIKEGRIERLGKVRNYIPYELCFYPYENYTIPARKHYKWSKKYCMSEKEIYRTSDIGDEFIIVTQDSKTIFLVYNTKFFELQEHKTL